MPFPTAPPIPVAIPSGSYTLPRANDNIVNVLFVCPSGAGHLRLSSIFSHSNWRLHKACNFEEAIQCLRLHSPPVVICDTETPGACWHRLIDAVHELEMRPEPRIIVCSRTADNQLWSEVLNLGGYNVLEQPFEASEVIWVVSHAWLDWKTESQRCCRAPLQKAFGLGAG